MSAELECWLARLYTDVELRERFLADPEGVLAQTGPARSSSPSPSKSTSPSLRQQLLAIDREGLRLHARSLAAKRRSQGRQARPRLRDRLRAWFHR